ncbi:MAG: Ig-like domain-containing protein [Candidatus Thermoplasmatota archaeon]|nr:Ig-like domain-containing protein [Candidatus Thermoplasmatota archaeon]
MKKIIIMAIILLPVAFALQPIAFEEADASGEEWNKRFGGEGIEGAEDIVQTEDGGYMVAGKTTSIGSGQRDGWLIKIDRNGNEIWNKTYGGGGEDLFNSISKVDQGYILGGYTNSYGAGQSDFWLVKIDSDGHETWNRTFGGENEEFARDVVPAKDGGYLLVGYTGSYGYGGDIWVVKTDEYGELDWERTFGGEENEWGNAVVSVEDGYAVVGSTGSIGAGGWDVWLVKINDSGYECWNRTYGGPGMERGVCIRAATDGGYVIAGTSNSYSSGEWNDALFLKTDRNGESEWSRVFGGDSEDAVCSIICCDGGGYILIGTTASYAIGYFDIWAIKTDINGDMIWEKTFGGRDRDVANCGIRLQNGGYMVAGETQHQSSIDMWIINTYDYFPPNIEIVSPKENHLYLFDREIMPMKNTLIIGGITVQTEVNDPGGGIDKVAFYLTGQDLYDYEPRTVIYAAPYTWNWNSYAIGLRYPYTVTVGAYYGQAGGVAADRETVYIINLGHSS